MNEFQQYYAQPYVPQQAGELAPQGFFGGLLGAPLGGLIGRGIGGLFGNANLGRQIGQAAGGIGGGLLPFGADPVAAAYLQQAQQQQLQQQLAPQGWLGDLMRKYRPYGGIISPTVPQPPNLMPFGADPMAQAYAQQMQQMQQLQQQQQLQQLQQLQQPQQLQEQGLAPQGWFGNILKSVARPVGGAIGGAFGNAGLGNTIGGIAGHLGGMLPFDIDPVAAAYAQQQAQLQQLAAQQGNASLYGGQTLH